MDKVNIDELVNYKEEYTKFVQKPEFKRDRMVSLCPFHDDRKPSFSVDLKTGKFVCFACGKAGNYVSFRAELDGTSNADACSFKPLTGSWRRFKCSSTIFPPSLQVRHRRRSRS